MRVPFGGIGGGATLWEAGLGMRAPGPGVDGRRGAGGDGWRGLTVSGRHGAGQRRAGGIGCSGAGKGTAYCK